MNPDAPQNRSSFWKTVREWTKTIIIALIIALPIRFFIAEPFIVSGASMDPTFESKQFLIVDRLTYRFEQPQRGDVIIFQYPNSPEDTTVYYIKRIIGLPGEKISISDGVVSVNGKPLKEPYVANSHVSHDTSSTVELGSTQYFVMGDNRAQSSDSRFWGPLDSKFIIGRPIVRLLPVGTVSILPGEERP